LQGLAARGFAGALFQPPGPARQDSKHQRGVKQRADLGEADIIGAGQPNIQASIGPDEQCIDDEARHEAPHEPATPVRALWFARTSRSDIDPRSVPLRRIAGERPQSLGRAHRISPQAHLGCEAGKGFILPGRKERADARRLTVGGVWLVGDPSRGREGRQRAFMRLVSVLS
jgi:hypothetical protein